MGSWLAAMAGMIGVPYLGGGGSWWSGSMAWPELPLPPGITACKRVEPWVNRQRVCVTLARTTLHPAEVDRFYQRKLPVLGWREEGGSNGSPAERRPLTFRKEEWECTIFAFPEAERRTTGFLLRIRPAQADGRRPVTGPRTLAERLGGFPLFPGVDGALLIEGGERASATLLYETEAPLEKVVQFYRRRLGEAMRPFPENVNGRNCASGTYRFRRWSVSVNLCRRPAGGTSALVVLERARLSVAFLAEGEVKTCSGGGT